MPPVGRCRHQVQSNSSCSLSIFPRRRMRKRCNKSICRQRVRRLRSSGPRVSSFSNLPEHTRGNCWQLPRNSDLVSLFIRLNFLYMKSVRPNSCKQLKSKLHDLIWLILDAKLRVGYGINCESVKWCVFLNVRILRRIRG